MPIELPTSEADAVSATGPPPTKAAARSPREFGFGLSAISKPDLVDQVLTQEVLEPGRWCNAR